MCVSWQIDADRQRHVHPFGCFEVVTEQKRGAKPGDKAKATGGQTRLIMTERRVEYDAGNRLGLPEVIECGTSAKEAWANFQTALKRGKETRE